MSKNRVLRYLWLGVVIFLLLPVSVVLAGEYVSVNRDSVNLRSGPGTNHDIIYKLPLNYPLEVIERKGQWLKVVDFEKVQGWIHSMVTSKQKTCIVTAKEVNIRSGPGTDNSKIGTVVREVVLKQISHQGDWIQFSHPQLKGWIFANLVWPRR